MPRVLLDGTEREELGDLCWAHGVFHILLVSKDQDGGILKRLWAEEPPPRSASQAASQAALPQSQESSRIPAQLS